jgi:hypothetical protein
MYPVEAPIYISHFGYLAVTGFLYEPCSRIEYFYFWEDSIKGILLGVKGCVGTSLCAIKVIEKCDSVFLRVSYDWQSPTAGPRVEDLSGLEWQQLSGPDRLVYTGATWTRHFEADLLIIGCRTMIQSELQKAWGNNCRTFRIRDSVCSMACPKFSYRRLTRIRYSG